MISAIWKIRKQTKRNKFWIKTVLSDRLFFYVVSGLSLDNVLAMHSVK